MRLPWWARSLRSLKREAEELNDQFIIQQADLEWRMERLEETNRRIAAMRRWLAQFDGQREAGDG